VNTLVRGAARRDDVFMGLAITSGLDKVVVPFVDYGVPVEYELVRSIATVTQQKRKTLGVVTTEVPLFRGFNPSTMSENPEQPVIEELRKQYDVKQVNPEEPITEKYDVLLCVQPS